MWTLELTHNDQTAARTYSSASEACGAVHHYLELYREQQKDVTIRMLDPKGRWMVIKKTNEGLEIENQTEI